jgi:hypothetical protein
MKASPEHNPKQAESTIQEIEEWDEDELLQWIHKKRPKLLRGDNLEKFKKAVIFGPIFLKHAGDRKYFHEECSLPIGPSEMLADLASEIAEGDKANRESKRGLSYHGHHLDSQLTVSQGEERVASTGKHASRVQS